MEGVGEGGLLGGHIKKVLVGNDQQGIHILLQFQQALFGQAHAPIPFEMERLGNHADGEDAVIAGGAGDHRRSPGAGAAAEPGGHEQHVGMVDMTEDLFQGFFRRGAADIRVRSGAKAPGHVDPHLDAALGGRFGQRLGVGVGDQELDPLEPTLDHIIHRVAAGAADANDRDMRFQIRRVRGCRYGKFDTHISLQ